MAICFALGLFFGPIWPTAMSIATQEFPSNSGRVTSLMLSFSGVGGAFSPIVMGSLADVAGFKASYLSLSIFAFAGLSMVLLYIKIKKSRFKI